MIPQIHTWIGGIFFRGGGPAEINAMTFHELKYWHEWHEAMSREERRSLDDAKRGKASH